MKTFRLMGMALFAIVMSVNFTSCSSDDDELIKNEDGVITNQKRLTRIKVVDDLPATWNFSYDSKGRLIALNKTGTDLGAKYRSTIDYTWGNNIIIAENNFTWGAGGLGEENYNYKETYFLNENLVRNVRKKNGENITFTYNSANQLIKVEEYDTESYTWQGEKMTIRTYEDDDYEEYTYSGKTCKGYFPLFYPGDPNDIDGLLFYAHPELIGLHCSQLPEQMYCKSSSSEHTYKYTYTFDKDGYVESCTIVDKDLSDADTYTTILTFTWE